MENTAVSSSQDASYAPVRAVIVDSGSRSPGLTAVAQALVAAGIGVDFRTSLLPGELEAFDVIIRGGPADTDVDLDSDITLGRLRIDVARRQISIDGEPLAVSAREFTLLHYLAARPNVVVSRETMLQAVWGSTRPTAGSVTEYIRRLRQLLTPAGAAGCIVTHKNFGYRFDPEPLMTGGR